MHIKSKFAINKEDLLPTKKHFQESKLNSSVLKRQRPQTSYSSSRQLLSNSNSSLIDKNQKSTEKFENDSDVPQSVKDSIEYQYKMRVTRFINDEELKKNVPENLVDDFIKKAVNNMKNNNSNSNSRINSCNPSMSSKSNISTFSSRSNLRPMTSVETKRSSMNAHKMNYLLPDLVLRMRRGDKTCESTPRTPRPSSSKTRISNDSKDTKSREDCLSLDKNIKLSSFKIANRSQSELSGASQPKKLPNSSRHNLIHSAPITKLKEDQMAKAKVKFDDDISINSSSSRRSQNTLKSDSFKSDTSSSMMEYDETSKEGIQESVAMIQEKLKKINEEEAENAKHRSNQLVKIDKKTILRDQKRINAKSMDVDKWIEIHRRRNTLKAVNLLNKNIILPGEEKTEDSFVKAKTLKKETRSRRQLIDITVLDKVQNRVKQELEENLRRLRKIESQTEFNSIVSRIKGFLTEIEDFKDNSLVSMESDQSYDKNRIRLYEYNFFAQQF